MGMETGTKVGEAKPGLGTVTNPVRNSRVAKNGHVRLIRQHPFCIIIMVSPTRVSIRLISNHFPRRVMISIQSPLAS